LAELARYAGTIAIGTGSHSAWFIVASLAAAWASMTPSSATKTGRWLAQLAVESTGGASGWPGAIEAWQPAISRIAPRRIPSV
jgi:hypothetical protein